MMARSLQERRIQRQAETLRINVVHIPEPSAVQDALRGAGWPLTQQLDRCRLKMVKGVKKRLWKELGQFVRTNYDVPVDINDCRVILYTGILIPCDSM